MANKSAIGLRIAMPEGDVCGTSQGISQRYKTILEIECDPQERFVRILNPEEFNQNRCLNIVQMKSRHGNIFFYI